MGRSKKEMVHRRAPGLGRRHLDVTRLAAAAGATQGDISKGASWGVVGHSSLDPGPPLSGVPTAAYLQVREGQLYCEVTTHPDGDEIVARVALDGAGLGSGSSFPIEYGCRVTLGFPDGDMGVPVVTGRMNDLVCQMPTTVAELPINVAAIGPETVGPAPFISYQKNPPLALDVVETTTADIMRKATAASFQVEADLAAILSAPLVHLGQGASFLVPPIPATAGPLAAIPGSPGIPNPALVIPIPNAAGIPGFGVVRHEDSIVANISSDAIMFTWILQVQTWIVGAHAIPLIGPVLSGLGIIPPVLPPVQIVSAPLTSSTSVTAS